jgi:acyltransferase
LKRIEWIDVAKGIGIFLVVIGHTDLPENYMIYIYSFHMPLFFFISGVLFSSNKFNNYTEFIKRKAKSLLVPYLFFSVLTYLFWGIIGKNHGADTSMEISIIKPLIGIFYSVGSDNWLLFNRPLWFLTCLFIVELTFFWFVKFGRKFLIIILFCFSILGYFLGSYSPIRLPWSLDIGITAIVFFGVGFLLKGKIHALLGKFKLIWMFLALGVNLATIKLNEIRVDMNNLEYGNYFYFYLGAFSGIIFSIILAKFLSRIETFKFFGRNSLIILSLHVLALTLVKGVQVYIFNLPLVNTGNSLYWSVLHTFSAFIFLLPAILLINNYFPVIIGKKV